MKQKLKSITLLAGLGLALVIPAKAQWPTIGTTNIYYNNTGNVGIGTGSSISPTEKLQVKGGNILLDYTSGNAGGNLFLGGVPGNGVNGMRLTCIDGSSGYIDVRTPLLTQGIIFRIDGTYGATERMRINGNGNVGIGISTPLEALQIGDRFTFHNGGFKGICYNFTYNGGDKRIVADYASGIFLTNSGTMLFRTATSGAAGSVISWQNNMTIANDGKIIIGSVSTPGDYKLYVQKGILAERVKVAVATSAHWADHVFGKNYELRTLNELEAFIKENKHLPNIPSAQEVVKEGLDLGTMDAKLLEKIEELTLYMIEMKKENEKMKADLANLTKKAK